MKIKYTYQTFVDDYHKVSQLDVVPNVKVNPNLLNRNVGARLVFTSSTLRASPLLLLKFNFFL